MSNFMMISGIFVWIMLTLAKIIFLKPVSIRAIQTLWWSIKPTPFNKGAEFGISVLQIIGMFWILCGIFLKSSVRPF
jgi:hypothetical protein